MESISTSHIQALLPERRKAAHKGDFGKILLICGSQGMAGAAVLAARGALRAGSGLVKVSIDESLFPVIHAGAVEATCIGRSFTAEILNDFDAIGLGPGLGLDLEAFRTVDAVLRKYEGKLIIDADALNIIAKEKLDTEVSSADIIITPHPGEAARLLGVSTEVIHADREWAAKALSERYGVTAVLKGKGTLIKSEGSDIFENYTGNPGMATAGSGDVLTGIITSFAGQGMNTKAAAVCGVYIHGLAGDLAAEKKGEYGLIASDIAEYTANALLSALA